MPSKDWLNRVNKFLTTKIIITSHNKKFKIFMLYEKLTLGFFNSNSFYFKLKQGITTIYP